MKRCLKIRTWSKDGWTRKEKIVSDRPKTSYQQTEFSKSSYKSDLTILQDAKDLIQIGQAQEALDNIPPALRYVLDATDCWHFSNNKLFRIVDPETQAKVYGEWGADKEEADIDILSDNPSIGRFYLEQEKIISSERTTEDYVDMMGELLETQNGEVYSNSPYMRVDINDSSDEEDEEENYCKPNENFVPVCTINEDILSRIKQEYEEDKNKANNSKEEELALLLFEQKIDKGITPQLTFGLNSPFCARGYTQPRRKHQFIQVDQLHPLTGGKEEREKLFWDLFTEASDCRTYEDLYGPVKNGERDFSKGFYGKLRHEKIINGKPVQVGMYQHDKEILIEWSINNIVDKDGKVLESAFNKQRREYIKELREKSIDEETIRNLTWNAFDREACTVPAKKDKSGKIISPSKQYKDSWWRRRRTKALSYLYLTKDQWGAIYKMLSLIKSKLDKNLKSDDEEKETIEILKKHFSRIQTLGDLEAYRRWAEKRNWYEEVVTKYWVDKNNNIREIRNRRKTYNFQPSLIDRLSMRNTNRWFRSIIKKKRYLSERMRLFNHLDNSIKSVKETNIKELSVDCAHPKCMNSTIGKPKFAEIKDNKGFLFVECECGRNIWLLDYKESGSDIKTLDQLEEKYN